jgi:predicted nucleotidyltransferase
MKLREDKTLLMMGLSGSHAYGLSTPESDYDYRGIAVGSKERYFANKPFEQLEGWTQYPEDALEALRALGVDTSEPDVTVFELLKFIKLLQDNNPNVLEFVYMADEDVLYRSEVYDTLRDNRDLFLCSAAKFRFTGYAHAQLKRLKTHRGWLLNPVDNKPERSDFDLTEEMSSANYMEMRANALKILQHASLDDLELSRETLAELQERLAKRMEWDLFSRKLEEENLSDGVLLEIGVDSKYVEYFKRETKYRQALKHYNDYRKWKKTRNERRAKLEAKCGYDSKHGMHLLRLMRMSVELLEGKGILVKREDREELMEVRRGDWPFERLEEEALRLEERANELYESTELQKKPRVNEIKSLSVSLLENHFYG